MLGWGPGSGVQEEAMLGKGDVLKDCAVKASLFTHCCGLNACVPPTSPQIPVETPRSTVMVMVSANGAFGKPPS